MYPIKGDKEIPRMTITNVAVDNIKFASSFMLIFCIAITAPSIASIRVVISWFISRSLKNILELPTLFG